MSQCCGYKYPNVKVHSLAARKRNTKNTLLFCFANNSHSILIVYFLWDMQIYANRVYSPKNH